MTVFSASLTVYVPKLATSPLTTAWYSSAVTWSILLAPNLGRSERVMNCAKLPFPSNMKMPFGSEPQRLLLVPSAFTSSAETKVQVPTICFLSVFPFCCARAVAATPASIAPTSIVSANLRCAVMAVLPGCSSIRFGATPSDKADGLGPGIVRDRDASGSGTSRGWRECDLDGARRGGRDAPAAIICLAERRRGDDARHLQRSGPCALQHDVLRRAGRADCLRWEG